MICIEVVLLEIVDKIEFDIVVVIVGFDLAAVTEVVWWYIDGGAVVVDIPTVTSINISSSDVAVGGVDRVVGFDFELMLKMVAYRQHDHSPR